MNKFRNKFFNVKGPYYWLSSPWFVAGVITLIYILSSPTFFNLYTAEFRAMYNKEDRWFSYEDMNCDGKDDVVKIKRDRRESRYIINTLKRNAFLEDKPFLEIAPFFGDYNADNRKEVYFLTKRLDSVFLTSWNINESKVKNVFLQQIKDKFEFGLLGFADANNDGCSEMYLWGCSNRHIDKRSIMRYDIKNDILIRTKNIDARINGGFVKNVDGKVNVVVSTKSYNTKLNTKSNYSENKAWIFILNGDLEERAKPICFNKSNYHLVCLDVKRDGKKMICVLGDNGSRKGKDKGVAQIAIYDYSGKLIDGKVIKNDLIIEHKGYLKVDKGDNSKIFVTCRTGGVMRYNSKLTYEGIFYPGTLDKPIPNFVCDIDGNGKNEIFFHDRSFKKLVITNENFSFPIEIELIEPYSPIKHCKPVFNIYENVRYIRGANFSKCRKENIILHCEGFMYFLKYEKDDYFWIKYIYALLVFCSVFFIVWWIRFFVTKNIEEKYRVENTIAQLKFQNVNNQMSPHFTLNAMNSIASLIYKEDRETAYDYLCKLAKLVRNSLVDANRLERSLKEELEFVESYLELQKFRFKNRFDYSISIESPSVYSYQVMPFLVQTFVENAMKHGLKDVGQGGKVSIKINSVKGGINIIIEDNGQGRKAAALNKSNSTGKGIKLVNEYIDILNKKDNRNMNIVIQDLEENNIPLGTRVIIFLDKV